jgi:hypothetical protein
LSGSNGIDAPSDKRFTDTTLPLIENNLYIL